MPGELALDLPFGFDLELALHIVLGIALVWLAWRVVTLDALFEEAVLFIVFGLVMALVWVRLGAPDIALAEAAIGAGLTGALVLDAVGQIDDRRRSMAAEGDAEGRRQDEPDERLVGEEHAEAGGR
jgi:energy-converting hydrogenase B subunit D